MTQQQQAELLAVEQLVGTATIKAFKAVNGYIHVHVTFPATVNLPHISVVQRVLAKRYPKLPKNAFIELFRERPIPQTRQAIEQVDENPADAMMANYARWLTVRTRHKWHGCRIGVQCDSIDWGCGTFTAVELGIDGIIERCGLTDYGIATDE